GQGRAAAVQRLARRDHDHGNPAARDHGERRGGRSQVMKAEGLLEEARYETAGGVLRGRLEFREGIEMRLANPERRRDFLTNRQTLADGVVFRRLFRSVPLIDPRDHRGRDQVALEAERGPRGHVGDRFARHDHTSLGMRTNKPITSGGRTASTLTREMDPAAARRRAWSSTSSAARCSTKAANGPASRSGSSAFAALIIRSRAIGAKSAVAGEPSMSRTS